jgi:hypothetical protein
VVRRLRPVLREAEAAEATPPPVARVAVRPLARVLAGHREAERLKEAEAPRARRTAALPVARQKARRTRPPRALVMLRRASRN